LKGKHCDYYSFSSISVVIVVVFVVSVVVVGDIAVITVVLVFVRVGSGDMICGGDHRSSIVVMLSVVISHVLVLRCL
jgi:hypothetical protein